MILPSNIERERKSNGAGFYTFCVLSVLEAHAFRKSALPMLLYFGLMPLATRIAFMLFI